MMLFPISELLDEEACHDYLLKTLHPEGLKCPLGHALPADQPPHDRHRAPIFDYRCKTCGKVFNLFTGTIWRGSHYSCRTIVLIVKGIAQGVPTLHLAQEIGISRMNLHRRRKQIQAFIERLFSPLSAAGSSGGGGRAVSKRGGKGRSARRSARSAPETGQ
jgi:hypothetical protein